MAQFTIAFDLTLVPFSNWDTTDFRKQKVECERRIVSCSRHGYEFGDLYCRFVDELVGRRNTNNRNAGYNWSRVNANVNTRFIGLLNRSVAVSAAKDKFDRS
jgi:hypothetical protein